MQVCVCVCVCVYIVLPISRIRLYLQSPVASMSCLGNAVEQGDAGLGSHYACASYSSSLHGFSVNALFKVSRAGNCLRGN